MVRLGLISRRRLDFQPLSRLLLAPLVVVCLACAGVVPNPIAGEECCSVEDVIRLSSDGVSDELIINTIRTSGTDLDLSADQIVELTNAGVAPDVIDVLNGGPCVCEPIATPDPVEAGQPSPSPKPDGVRTLHLAVNYSGGKSMEIVNLSKNDFTNVTLVVNDEYQYRVKKLKANSGDFMRFSSFVSRRTGAEAKKIDMKSIVITADQGTYSRTF